MPESYVAIVDHGLGNLFSVKHACEASGLRAVITASPDELTAADAVILPGVGAFGDAMQALERLGLVELLQEIARSERPLVGICLGMQLLMTGSHEFGWHRGLGIIEGEVLPLKGALDGARRIKVPHMGWNRISSEAPELAWRKSLLEGCADGEFMYFVHSFYVKPAPGTTVLSTTTYGPLEFCSSVQSGSVFACQFHPERSGAAGLNVYRNLARLIRSQGATP